MATFLLIWHPVRWTEPEYDEFVVRTGDGEIVEGEWSVGVRRGGIEAGDRAFLFRQYSERGIVAAGIFASQVYQGDHWDGSRREANYADVEWDTWLPLDDRLTVESLQAEVPGVAWMRLQASGIAIADDAARRLEQVWERHLESRGRGVVPLPEEVPRSERFSEGARSRVEVNRYERSPAARSACLREWGHTCVVCGLNFAEVYGAIGANYIHVHHLRELSELPAAYEVDPVNDLRPVCANCHAMLHRRRPAYTVDELKAAITSPR